MNNEYEQILTQNRELIERELEQALHSSEQSLEGNLDVVKAMKYSTLGGGKRIRGVLTLEFCRVFGGDIKRAALVSAAVELIQAFSLIHDDLPCMDNDDFRRGKPSCHKKFGEAAALLAGDALLATAFNTAAATAFLPKGLKPLNAVSVISALSNATADMVKGQQMDIDFEKKLVGDITEDELMGMYNRKTCALISAACVSGALCADAGEKKIHAARGYGVALGLAFQLNDDLLDFSNEKKDKKTYATLFGENKTKEKAAEYTETAVNIADKFPKGDFLRELALNLNKRNA
jgi:geranylgeranyl diphosphate synthase type II